MEKAHRDPCLRQDECLPHLSGVEVAHPCGSKTQTYGLHHHVHRNDRSIGATAGLPGLGMVPTCRLVIADHKDRRCLVVEPVAIARVALLSQRAVLLPASERAALLHLPEMFAAVDHNDTLGLRIDCGRRPATRLQDPADLVRFHGNVAVPPDGPSHSLDVHIVHRSISTTIFPFTVPWSSAAQASPMSENWKTAPMRGDILCSSMNPIMPSTSVWLGLLL